VVGFDGLDLPWLAPSVLSSVHQPLRVKGKLLAQAVLDLINSGDVTETYLPAKFVVGNTTSAPRMS